MTVVLIGLGCAGSSGPLHTPEFEPTLRQSVALGGEKLELFGEADWFPDTHGLEDLLDDFRARDVRIVNGVLVLTDERAVLVEWDEEAGRYSQLMSLPYGEVLSVELEERGRARLLIVQRRDLTFQTFQFTERSGVLVSPRKTEEAAELLRRNLTGTMEGQL